jgi:FkbM family methyltransferase
MKLLGRDLSLYRRLIPGLPKYFLYFGKCIRMLKNPIAFIRAYLTSTALPSGVVEFRNGLKIFLSGHPHDVITVFVIFFRKDYGDIPADGLVVDVGANIGVFSLFAFYSGARKIFAYEPNTEAYRLLLENIRINHAQDVIIPCHLAVTGSGTGKVKFPARASMYNAIITGETQSEYELVETVSLGKMVNEIGGIDLLKLDCEGAEYEILYQSEAATLSRARSIRLEYHCGKAGELIAFLRARGFTHVRHMEVADISGSIWCRR